MALLFEHNEFLINKKNIKNDIVQADNRELGDVHGICKVPPLDELLNATIDEHLY